MLRKNYIDYLRLIAILAVITIHVTANFYTQYGKIGYIGWWLANLLNSASRFSVPLFVMISGAVLLGRTMSVTEFYRKRSARLLPPIIFWSIFYLGFNFYKDMDVNTLIWNLKIGLFAEGRAAGHLWFLSMFMCLMIFAPFINIFLNGDKPAPTDILMLLAAMFSFFILNDISRLALEFRNIKIEWFKSFPWFIAYFIAGFYLDKYGENLKIRNFNILFSIMTLIVIGSVLNYYVAASRGIVSDTFALSNTGPLVFVMALLLFLFAKNRAASFIDNTIVSKVSEASFGMYLIHPVFIYLLSNSFPAYDSTPLFYIPITIILTTVASLFSILLIRKSSFMRALC